MATGDRPRYDLRSLSDIIKRAITTSLRNPHVLFLNFQAMAIRSSVLRCLIFFGILERAGLGLFTMWRKYIWSCFFFFNSITKINANILHLFIFHEDQRGVWFRCTTSLQPDHAEFVIKHSTKHILWELHPAWKPASCKQIGTTGPIIFHLISQHPIISRRYNCPSMQCANTPMQDQRSIKLLLAEAEITAKAISDFWSTGQ